jgi:inner membrane protein
MDPLTHGLLGAVSARAVFGDRLPKGGAIVAGLAAMAPDLDLFINPSSDPTAIWINHRNFTHGLPFVPVGAALSALPFLAFKRFREPVVFGATLVAYFTHPILDACTSYGTQLFRPFTDTRVAWDLVSVIDPFFTVPLLAGLLWSVYRRTRGLGILLFIAAYFIFCGWQHARALTAQSQLASERGTAVERGRVMPMLFSPLLWRSVYISNGRIFADGVRLLPFKRGGVREGGQISRATPLPAAVGNKPESIRAFKVLDWFADGYVSASTDTSSHLLAGDQRFAINTGSTTPLWGLEFDQTLPDGFKGWGAGVTGRLAERQLFWRELVYGEGYRPMTPGSPTASSP